MNFWRIDANVEISDIYDSNLGVVCKFFALLPFHFPNADLFALKNIDTVYKARLNITFRDMKIM